MNLSPAALGVTSKYHNHPLKYAKYTEKGTSGYSGGWSCDECRAHYGAYVENLYCGICGYDLCEKCRKNEEVNIE